VPESGRSRANARREHRRFMPEGSAPAQNLVSAGAVAARSRHLEESFRRESNGAGRLPVGSYKGPLRSLFDNRSAW
jgi:hypothetical protein